MIAQIPNISKVLKRHEVDMLQFTAGRYKRTVTTTGEVTPEGRAKLQEELETIHAAFSDHVALFRPVLLPLLPQITTGEVWLGRDALAMRLVDSVALASEVINNATRAAVVIRVTRASRRSRGLLAALCCGGAGADDGDDGDDAADAAAGLQGRRHRNGGGLSGIVARALASVLARAANALIPGLVLPQAAAAAAAAASAAAAGDVTGAGAAMIGGGAALGDVALGGVGLGLHGGAMLGGAGLGAMAHASLVMPRATAAHFARF